MKDRVLADTPREARTLLDRLLDRLQQAEAMLVGHDSYRKALEIKLERAEAVVEAAKQYRERFTALNVIGSDGAKDIAGVPRDVHEALLKALAAWEEGK